MSLFSITPVPESENSHDNAPAYVAVPATANGTSVPSSRPDAVPTTEILPGHVAEKLPAIESEVVFVTCHWKLPQEPAEGTAVKADVHVPAYDPEAGGGLGAGGGAGGGAGAGAAGALAVALGAVGRSISDLLSTAHAVPKVVAVASVANSIRVLFMVCGAGSAVGEHGYKPVRARTELCGPPESD